MSTRAPPRRTILVVDDDDDIRATLSLVLSGEGYAVREAANGRDALLELQERAALPDLILLDLMMPVMDGWQFRARAKKEKRLARIPTIVLTASPQNDLGVPPVAGRLRKPVDLEELLGTIARVCGPGAAN